MGRTASWRTIIAIPCMANLGVACGDGVQPGRSPVEMIEVTPRTIELMQGDTATIVATVLGAADTALPDIRVAWTSRQPSKASVDDQGRVTALAGPSGGPDMTFYVVAMAGKRRDSALVYLHRGVGRIEFDSPPGRLATTATVMQGDPLNVTVRVVDSGGAAFKTPPVVLTSRNPALLWESDGRLVTNASSWGSTYLVASTLGVSDSLLVKVSRYSYVWPDTSVILPGMTRQLRVESYRSSTGIVTLDGATWSSSNPAVASVEANGQVTAHGIGEAIITGVREGETYEAFVRVFAHPSLLRFTSVSTHWNFACGLTASGDAYCWGANDQRQLGTDAEMDRCEYATQYFGGGSSYWIRTVYKCSAAPRRVESDAGFRDVQAGCGLTPANRVYCWGSMYGLSKSVPTLLPGPELEGMTLGGLGWPGGAHACGIGVDGLGFCWGSEGSGARGDGTGRTAGYSAIQVATATRWSVMSADFDMTCALDDSAVPYCWGQDPGIGPGGAFTASCYLRCVEVPTRVEVDPRYSAVRFTQIAAGYLVSCAIGTDARVYCWGGESGRALSLRPAASQPAKDFVYIARGPCALTVDGETYCLRFDRDAVGDSAFSMSRRDVAVLLKRISGNCGIGFDDIAYCWESGKTPTRVGGQP